MRSTTNTSTGAQLHSIRRSGWSVPNAQCCIFQPDLLCHLSHERMATMRRVSFLLIGSVAVSVTLLAQTPGGSLDRPAAQPKSSGTTYSSKRMADGKQWTTQNLNVSTAQSYCYEDAALNCRQYGR